MGTRWLMVILMLLNHSHRGETQHAGECTLLPSELGLDWYKVPQPVPVGFDHDPSYTHMPCAPTTVFELSVCGCTNLLSFLFSSSGNKRSRIVTEPEHKIGPGDFVKTVDPEESEPAGSLLINTRTGEVRKCQFRASSRGPHWYMVREHGVTWIPMECAAGTLFDKLTCTCIHRALALRDPSAPEDKDIVFIEEAFETFGVGKGNTISESLGIRVKDVDFGFDALGDRGAPSWGQESRQNTKNIQGANFVKSDVHVTLNRHDNGGYDVTNQNSLDIGDDIISDAHRALLLRLRKGPKGIPFKQKTKATPLFLDRIVPDREFDLTNKFDQPLDVSVNIKANLDKPIVQFLDNNLDSIQDTGVGVTIKTEIRFKNIPFSQEMENIQTSQRKSIGVQKEDIPIQRANIQSADSHELRSLLDAKVDVDSLANVLSDITKQIVSKEEINGKGDTTSGDLKSATETDENIMHLDDVLIQSECLKKPMAGLDPHYFLLPVPGVGYIPYTCHGNYVYDHSICACRKAPGETSYNEEAFPIQECTKYPIPEFGQKFFRAHILGFGYIPIGCHGSTVFDEQRCACV